MSARAETRLWLAQRASAAVLALCVAVHLVTMIAAVRGGLTAAEMLGRTRFPAIGELPYMVTLGPYGFYWFQLTERDKSEPVTPRAGLLTARP